MEKEYLNGERVTSKILLRNNRKLITTKNGFKYYIVEKNGNADEVSHEYYKKALKTRLTKKELRKVVI